MNCFARLGIDETTDIKAIKAAYAGLLPKHSPETDSDGFQALRAAFEEARDFAAGKRVEPPKTPLDAFMDRFAACYNDYAGRLDEERWRTLLEDPLCQQIDSAEETERRIIDFLMENYYYPHPVWLLFDNIFGWIRRQQALSEQFPEGFVEFMLEKIRIKSSFEFHELLAIPDDAETFLNEHGKGCRALDSSDYFQVLSSIEKLEGLLPGQTNLMILKGRYNAALNRVAEAGQCYASLVKGGIRNLDLFYYAGEFLKERGQLEDAKKMFLKALEIKADSNGTAYYYGRCCLGLRQYLEAVDCFKELAERLPGNQEVGELLQTSCRFAIRQMEENSDNLSESERFYQMARMNLLAGNHDSSRDLLKSLQANAALDSQQNNLLGKAAHASGNTDEALQAFSEALRQTPDDIELLMAKAGCLHDAKRYEEAIETYERVIHQKDNDTSALNNLAHALIQIGREEEALHYCNQAIAIDSRFAWAYKNRAVVRLKLERYEECLADSRRAITLQPQLKDAYVVQMKALNELGRYSQTHQIFSEAMDNGVQHDDLIMQKAHAYRLMEDYEGAMTGYQTILETQPENGDAHLNRGECLYRLKQYPEAIEAFELALGSDGDPFQSYWMKGLSLFKQEQYQDVQSCLEEALSRNIPGQDRFYRLLGNAMVELDRREEALVCYRKCIEIDPENYEYCFEAGFCLSDLGRFEESLSLLDQALRLDAEDEDSLICKSYVHSKLNRYNDSVTVCDQILANSPANETAIRNKSWALYRLEQADQAMEILNSGLRQCGEHDYFLDLKIIILRDKQMFHDALAVTNRYLELYPDSTIAKTHYQELGELLNQSWLKRLLTFKFLRC